MKVRIIFFGATAAAAETREIADHRYAEYNDQRDDR